MCISKLFSIYCLKGVLEVFKMSETVFRCLNFLLNYCVARWIINDLANAYGKDSTITYMVLAGLQPSEPPHRGKCSNIFPYSHL